ncbi:hypothetical protein HHK36_026082 [Tetracentron sinense]|uniref:Uncharacterized protein n=1 Tax=Tetracentron sinense TaxID=13715 RepID=A0A835D673_TETSI|nr:hypothetical protein HHK36_026082 [Tetracentron sinense]
MENAEGGFEGENLNEEHPNSATEVAEPGMNSPLSRQSSRTPLTNLSQVDADLALDRTLQEQVDCIHKMRSSAVCNDARYCWEAIFGCLTSDRVHKEHVTNTESWEKAEAEALALKHQLESRTLLKLTAEDRVSHLDGALKECMRQIRNLKEEHEQKLHEHFQERSNMLMKISEEKSQAEAEIEFLKSNIQSYEREISSFKYELHIVSKELEIRNEEKNMSIRSAEVANKQHLEAALVQMKLEVDNLGRDYGEPRLRRSPVKSPRPHMDPLPELSLDIVQQSHKEIEFLTARLLTMEEETKMLKEALAKRNSELQALRNIHAKTASNLRSLEAQMEVPYKRRISLASNVEIPPEGFSSQAASKPPSLTSMSEDGNDDEGSFTESWTTSMICDLSHSKKGKSVDKSNNAVDTNHLELMDDFLKMERLACLSTDSNGAISISDSLNNKRTEVAEGGDLQSKQQPSANQVSSNAELSAVDLESDTYQMPLSKLQSRISMIFDSQADTDMEKILEDMKCIVKDVHDTLPQHYVSYTFEEFHSIDATCNRQACPQDISETTEGPISLIQDSKPGTDTEHVTDQELVAAISQIHDFVLSLGKEAMTAQETSLDGHWLSKKIEELFASVNKVYTAN